MSNKPNLTLSLWRSWRRRTDYDTSDHYGYVSTSGHRRAVWRYGLAQWAQAARRNVRYGGL
jgi:hypothetical protein